MYLNGDGFANYIIAIFLRLRGKRFLVRENHDKIGARLPWDGPVVDVARVVVPNIDGSATRVFCSHFAHRVWPGMHRGDIHLFGHSHGSLSGTATSTDVGVDCFGYGTKACVIADGSGRAIAFRLAPGQAHELPHAVPLLDQLPGVPKWVVGDRGYTSHAFRDHIWDIGARLAIPTQRHEAPVACPDWIYNNRHHVERLWARLKEWRAISTRYEKTAVSFMGVLCLAAAVDWLKR